MRATLEETNGHAARRGHRGVISDEEELLVEDSQHREDRRTNTGRDPHIVPGHAQDVAKDEAVEVDDIPALTAHDEDSQGEPRDEDDPVDKVYALEDCQRDIPISCTRPPANKCRRGQRNAATEGFVEALLSTHDARLAVISSEPGGVVRLSIRSRAPARADRVAKAFVVGGHALVAGAHVEGPLEEVTGRVPRAVRSALRGR